ncbi:MAG: hypothetical protein MUC96_17120 [Myxococcaceae bacterium]|jgi:hypothetical protein|nr:hypothetical protein [Myxococcaceae bacterium]
MSLARVTHAEASLLTLARCAVGAGPTSELTRLLLVSVSPPAKLGPTSAGLLEETLARGVAHALLEAGGWTREVTGRLWDAPLPALRFTANVVRLLQWALKLPLAEPEVSRLELQGALTPAEEVFAALLLERARGTAAEATLMLQPELRRAPLVQLVHAASLGRVGPLEAKALTAQHLPFVRGLLDLLGDAWLSAEQLKPQLAQPKVLASVGRAQAAVAAAFLDVIEAAQARHLARFFVDAAAAWLASHQTAADLVQLDAEAPLRERGDARREAGALWRVVQRLEQWDQQHRATRFIDDGYDTAQALVKDWERLGPAGFRAAERLVAELEGLPT